MYITFFRNLGTGLRTPFDDPSIGSTALVDDYTGKAYYCPSGLASCVQTTPGPLRAAGPMAYSYWFAFVGNVLGVSGTTTAANGWTYSGDFTGSRIFMLGWMAGNGGQDPNLDGTISIVHSHQRQLRLPQQRRDLAGLAGYASKLVLSVEQACVLHRRQRLYLAVGDAHRLTANSERPVRLRRYVLRPARSGALAGRDAFCAALISGNAGHDRQDKCRSTLQGIA